MYDNYIVGEATQYAKSQHEGDAYEGEPYEELAGEILTQLDSAREEAGWSDEQCIMFLAHILANA